MTLFLIVLCLLFIAALFGGGGYVQYRRNRGSYERIAIAVYDPRSWRVRFRLRTLVLSGKIDGRSVCYTVLGDSRRNEPANSYLLLNCPVTRNFRFYAGSDPEQTDDAIRDSLARLQETPGFRGLLAVSARTPILARLIARPLGFGYEPGLLLWRWGPGGFEPETVKRDHELLVSLQEKDI